MANVMYAVSIAVAKPPDVVFNQLIDLSKWWVEECVAGELKLNSEFILKIGDAHFSKNKVIAFVPGKAFAWVTTASRRSTDGFDWTGTKMIFRLTPQSNGTVIMFTYDGVVLDGERDKLREICDHCIEVLLYNYLESFTATVVLSKPPEEVFEIITRDVSKWWGGKDLSGSHSVLNDEFVVHHPGAHYSVQKLTEVVPNKKITWLVTDSLLHWLKNDKREWTNTRMFFEIYSNNKGGAILHFTHSGLVPAKECYSLCRQGWSEVINNWLFQYVEYGKVNERFL